MHTEQTLFTINKTSPYLRTPYMENKITLLYSGSELINMEMSDQEHTAKLKQYMAQED